VSHDFVLPAAQERIFPNLFFHWGQRFSEKQGLSAFLLRGVSCMPMFSLEELQQVHLLYWTVDFTFAQLLIMA